MIFPFDFYMPIDLLQIFKACHTEPFGERIYAFKILEMTWAFELVAKNQKQLLSFISAEIERLDKSVVLLRKSIVCTANREGFLPDLGRFRKA